MNPAPDVEEIEEKLDGDGGNAMSLKVVCCVCDKIISPGPSYPVSHGYCRLCELRAYLVSGLLRGGELEEFLQLSGDSR